MTGDSHDGHGQKENSSHCPPSVRPRAGIKPDDKLEFRASGGVITIRASTQILEDDEYTSEQRRAILADAKEGLREIGEGKFYGPFETAAELREFVEREVGGKDEARKRKSKVKKAK